MVRTFFWVSILGTAVSLINGAPLKISGNVALQKLSSEDGKELNVVSSSIASLGSSLGSTTTTGTSTVSNTSETGSTPASSKTGTGSTSSFNATTSNFSETTNVTEASSNGTDSTTASNTTEEFTSSPIITTTLSISTNKEEEKQVSKANIDSQPDPDGEPNAKRSQIFRFKISSRLLLYVFIGALVVAALSAAVFFLVALTCA
ncbi:hypothetical protein L596_018503 [Steinernema carpocapsae]|uniref:Uncharacterized protein n=1 Tax=Steinernema carpocapsae TaxID=34508 RepID=A0A4U5N5N1_STECR|nr:hypothetical protein L596_018503 [Steinernema carpocapsae]